MQLTIDDESLETTPEHPFFTSERGWVTAHDLRLGEHVRRLDGSTGVVRSLWVETEPQVMYNLTVAGAHTFFVGEERWLVHNSGGCWTSTKHLSSVENALEHWNKHKAEFPELQNAKQYVEKAWDFTSNPPAGVQTKLRSNGDVVLWDSTTNIFAVKTNTGEPRTMFKPDPAVHGYPTNQEYFDAQ